MPSGEQKGIDFYDKISYNYHMYGYIEKGRELRCIKAYWRGWPC